MNRCLLFLLFLLLVSACTEEKQQRPITEDRDKIITKYFKIYNALKHSDTLDAEFMLLKAYYNNDTAYLRGEYNTLAQYLKEEKEGLGEGSCEEPTALLSLKFEEVYRFTYDAAFCDTAVILTIGRMPDSIALELYVYAYERSYNQDKDKIICKIAKHISRRMDENTWDIIKNDIEQADFWGLKRSNGAAYFDGSMLSVAGYKWSKREYNSIKRSCAERMPIGIVFKKLLDLSGMKITCFHYR